jgi:hypothetical protein
MRFIFVFLFLLFISPTHAQTPELPVILLLDGDLYRWYEGDSSVQRLTHSGYIEDVSLSPDGSQVVYHAYDPVTVDAINRIGKLGSQRGAGNIWMMDAAKGEARQLVEQPADAAFFSRTTADNAIIRSKPFWSPDGTKVGWTEVEFPSQDALPSFWVYDFATDTALKHFDLPRRGRMSNGIYKGYWTEIGILFEALEFRYPLYSETGELLNEIKLENNSSYRPAGFIEPVQYNGNDYLLVQYYYPMGYERDWVVYNLLSGGGRYIPGITVLRGVSALDPDDSIVMVGQWGGYGGTPVNKQGEGIIPHDLKEAVSVLRLAISPDGEAVAYVATYYDREQQDWLGVWRDGEILSPIPLPQGVISVEQILWTPMLWYVVEEEFSP